MSLAGIVWAAGVAGAEPPQYCRDLGAQFGAAPGQLDANALAALRACVTAEIQQRSGAAGQSAPPVQQPDAGASPIDQPGWGQWGPPAPWSDGGAKPQPWGDFKNP